MVLGSYRPPTRDLVLQIRTDSQPKRVLLSGQELEEGWRWADGVVEVRRTDSPEGLRVELEF